MNIKKVCNCRVKKKKGYTDYDYEAAYQNNVNDYNESFMEMMLRQNKFSCAYVTKTIKAGTQFEVEIYPVFAKKSDVPSHFKKSNKYQQNLNDKNSKKRLERKINANFVSGDLWITFTYDDDHLPDSMDQAEKNIKNFIKRLNYKRKKRKIDNAKYVYVTEWQEDVRCHHHLVMDSELDLDEVEASWMLSSRNEIRRVDYNEDGLSGMANYMAKAPIAKTSGAKSKKSWRCSKNLKEPKESVSFTKFKNNQVKKMVRNQNEIAGILEKNYPNYQFKDVEIKFNDFNGKFYVYARMRERKLMKARI